MKKHYIQAVLEMIRAGGSPEQVLSGLNTVLKAKGHESLKASVLFGVVRVLEAESARSGASVTVATKAHAEKYANAIKAVLQDLGAPTDYVVKEDATLIGGFVAENNNVVHDASYKTSLVTLYRKLTK